MIDQQCGWLAERCSPDHTKDWMISFKSCFSFRTTNSRWKSVWKSSLFSFLEVRPGLGLQRVLKEDFGFVSSVNHFFFFQRSIFGTKLNKRKKRVFRRHLGKSHGIGYHGTRQFIEIQFILEGLFLKRKKYIYKLWLNTVLCNLEGA